jgi:hypothetical protein
MVAFKFKSLHNLPVKFFSPYKLSNNMGGGLLQLVAYGAQDVYLTGNPQITFFKVVYRRHTNFSMESIEQTFNGSADFGKRVTCQISRNGDLIHRMYLQVTVPACPATAQWTQYIGLALIKNVEIEIGGQRIDKHYSEWMYIWNDLSLPAGKRTGYNNMVGRSLPEESEATTLYVPLEFWFCRNPGLALPLIALQYHEVKVNMEFRDKAHLVRTTVVPTGSLEKCSLWVDYIFLDTDERRRFAQLSHEYLIEQLQFTGDESVTGANNKVKLNFNHPVKELVWVSQLDAMNTVAGGKQQYFNFTDRSNVAVGSDIEEGVNVVLAAKLQLNGHDRFAEREGSYFNMVQPFQHHENVPTSKGINVYSFALQPESHQPSGTLNMSRIDAAVLNVQTSVATAAKLKVFALSYNVLRVMSGMGGLAYSN